MAFLTVVRFKGDTDQMLEHIKEADATVSPIAREHGGLVHVVARSDDGVVMVNLWESKEGSDAMAADPRFREAVANDQMPQPEFEHYDVAWHELS